MAGLVQTLPGPALPRHKENTDMDCSGFEPVRIGVVGLGHFGRQHALTLAGLAEAKLVALVARRQASLEAVRDHLPDVPGWLELDQAIAQSGAEAWVVASSTASHVPVARALLAAGRSGAAVNIKKGQFLSPWEMKHAVEKVRSTGNERVLVTERGTSFGYQNLVVDMRSFAVLREFGCPVVFDLTHSLQLPGGDGLTSGGQRQFGEVLARAAVAAGVDGLFLEVHDNPSTALSDTATQWPLERLEPLLEQVMAIDRVVHR